MDKTEQISKRGGFRTNAGRKSEGKISVNIRLKPETKSKLFKMAEEEGTNIGKIIDRIIAEL